MRSYGHLWERIVSPENFGEAWRTYRRHHPGQNGVRRFGENAEENLERLRASLAGGAWKVGGYRSFRIYEPKPRTISCVGVEDRIVHQAFCNVCAPLMERRFIEQSYACREGKGSHRAQIRARELCREYPWFVKLDVRRYFESIGHGRLLGLLGGMFREREVGSLCEKIVRSWEGPAAGKGLPIGNLTSQWFANLYLDGLDHHATEELRLGARYLRYMDDMVVFVRSKAEAWGVRDAIADWLAEERGLSLKEEATVVSPTWRGVPFLGLWIRPGGWRFKRDRFLRSRRSARRNFAAWRVGETDEERLHSTLRAMDGANAWYGMRGIVRAVEIEQEAKPPEDFKALESDVSAGSASSRRIRGGGNWNNAPSNDNFLSSYRNNNASSNRNNNIGFRVASNCTGCKVSKDNTAQDANPVPNACSLRDGDEQAKAPRGRVGGAMPHKVPGERYEPKGEAMENNPAKKGLLPSVRALAAVLATFVFNVAAADDVEYVFADETFDCVSGEAAMDGEGPVAIYDVTEWSDILPIAYDAGATVSVTSPEAKTIVEDAEESSAVEWLPGNSGNWVLRHVSADGTTVRRAILRVSSLLGHPEYSFAGGTFGIRGGEMTMDEDGTVITYDVTAWSDILPIQYEAGATVSVVSPEAETMIEDAATSSTTNWLPGNCGEWVLRHDGAGGEVKKAVFNVDVTLGHFTVTWKREDGTVIDTTEYFYGETAEHEDAEMESAGDSTIEFCAWWPRPGMVTGDAEYTAKFTERVTSQDGFDLDTVIVKDGTAAERRTMDWDDLLPVVYKKGATVVAKDPDGIEATLIASAPEEGAFDPVDPGSNKPGLWTFTHTLDGVTQTALIYLSAENFATVNWRDDDWTLYETTYVSAGDTPSRAAPERDDAQYTYTFLGWGPSPAPAVAGATYNYTSVWQRVVKTYKIVWKDWDDTVLETDLEVPYGEMAEYGGEEPVRADDGVESYIFTGWDPEPDTVRTNAEYVARFRIAEAIAGSFLIAGCEGAGSGGNAWKLRIVPVSMEEGRAAKWTALVSPENTQVLAAPTPEDLEAGTNLFETSLAKEGDGLDGVATVVVTLDGADEAKCIYFKVRVDQPDSPGADTP